MVLVVGPGQEGGAEGERQDGARGWVWYKEAKEELEVLGTILSFF